MNESSGCSPTKWGKGPARSVGRGRVPSSAFLPVWGLLRKLKTSDENYGKVKPRRPDVARPPVGHGPWCVPGQGGVWPQNARRTPLWRTGRLRGWPRVIGWPTQRMQARRQAAGRPGARDPCVSCLNPLFPPRCLKGLSPGQGLQETLPNPRQGGMGDKAPLKPCPAPHVFESGFV